MRRIELVERDCYARRLDEMLFDTVMQDAWLVAGALCSRAERWSSRSSGGALAFEHLVQAYSPRGGTAAP